MILLHRFYYDNQFASFSVKAQIGRLFTADGYVQDRGLGEPLEWALPHAKFRE